MFTFASNFGCNAFLKPSIKRESGEKVGSSSFQLTENKLRQSKS